MIMYCCANVHKEFTVKDTISSLFHSRKFLILVVDTLLSLVLYFTGKYLAPTSVDDIKFVIVSLQPVFGIIIGGIAIEDAAMKLNMPKE